MGRAIRPDLPGVVFHLTARVQAREPLLLGVEAAVVERIHATALAARIGLCAHVVMSNHLHVVVVQGTRPLAWFMQQLLRGVALLVQRHHRREDHVFGRRYAHRACLDASYFRNAIAYVHLNPVRAGICTDPADYPWSSHQWYGVAQPPVIGLSGLTCESALRVFARRDRQHLHRCRADYLRFIAWRQSADRFLADGGTYDDPTAPPCPDTTGGNIHWAADFSAAAAATAQQRPDVVPMADVSVIARRTLARLGIDVPLPLLRSGMRSHAIIDARRHVIARCLFAGHPPARIARYLRISDSTVRNIAADMSRV